MGNKPLPVVATADIWRVFPLALLAFVALACGGPAKGPEVAQPAGEWRTFKGTWTTTGHRQALRLGPDRKTTIFSLSGSMLIVGERRLGVGFQCRVIGYSDSAKGIGGWCVWTDTRGDQVFSEIRGEPIGARRRISGTILGGTGQYAGSTGEYEVM